MPKSRKRKNADFQKVKLKVGKKLPKGDNVMNLSFKTRQIQLTQKIREGDGLSPGAAGATSKQKYTVVELLRQCDHHSTNSRLNAVQGLKDTWVASHPELVVTSNEHGCAEILKKLSSMLIDNEAVVRHAVINLFKIILTTMKGLSENSAILVGGGLFKHIHAFLCCAMKHIHEDIRLDALVLFDTLLDTFPKFIVQQTGDLLTNLLGLISSSPLSSPLKHGSHVKSNQTAQHLSMNPESKLPALTFCTRVLTRIRRTLQEAFTGDPTSKKGTLHNFESHKNRTWKLGFDCMGKPFKQDTLIVPTKAANKFHSMISIASDEMSDYITKSDSLERFARLSLPVLVQCWKEAKAELTNQNASEASGSADCYEVMSLVVSIIELLLSLYLKLSTSARDPVQLAPLFVDINCRGSFEKNFAQILMENFPYSGHIEVQSQKKKKKKKTSISTENRGMQNSLISLNLGLCHIMSCFCADQTFSDHLAWLSDINQYITTVLTRPLTAEQTNVVSRILQNIFVNPQTLESSTDAFRALWNIYSSGHMKSNQKKTIFDLFSSVVKKWDGWKRDSKGPQPVYHYQECEALQEVLEEFSQSLPSLLLDVLKTGGDHRWAMNVLETMACGHVQNCSRSFHTSFQDSMSELLDKKEGILAVGNEAIQRKFIFLLSSARLLNKEHLKSLLFAVRRPVDKPVLALTVSCSLACQVVTNVFLNMINNLEMESQKEFDEMDESQHIALSEYFSFIFSLQIGMTSEELGDLSPSADAKDVESKWPVINFDLGEDQWNQHVDIATYVISELMNLRITACPSQGYNQTLTFIKTFEHRWKKILSQHTTLHIMSIYSLIQFLHQASLREMPLKKSGKLFHPAARIISCVMACLFGHRSNSHSKAEIIDKLKTDIVDCLTRNIALACQVWKNLDQRSKETCNASESEKQKAKLGMEFLLSVDELRIALSPGPQANTS